MSIKPPNTGPSNVVPLTGDAAPDNIQQAKSNNPVQQGVVINPEAVAKALKDYKKLREKLKQPSLTGAAGLFTENVVFPQELLDPNNPANDPKYLHMLLAIFGLKEMKEFFSTDDQKEEDQEEETSQEEPEEESSH